MSVSRNRRWYWSMHCKSVHQLILVRCKRCSGYAEVPYLNIWKVHMNVYPLLPVIYDAAHIKPRLYSRYTDLVSWFRTKKGSCSGLSCNDCFFQSDIAGIFCHGTPPTTSIHSSSSCRYRLYLLDIVKAPRRRCWCAIVKYVSGLHIVTYDMPRVGSILIEVLAA